MSVRGTVAVLAAVVVAALSCACSSPAASDTASPRSASSAGGSAAPSSSSSAPVQQSGTSAARAAAVEVPNNPLCRLLTVQQAQDALGEPVTGMDADDAQCSWLHGPKGYATGFIEVGSECGEQFAKWHAAERTVPGEPKVRVNEDVQLAFATVGTKCYTVTALVGGSSREQIRAGINQAVKAAAVAMVHNAKS